MPRIEQLHQNTPDWHRWRLQGIGASDAPVIMGDGAFKTPRTLWSIKTGRMREDAAGLAARRGRELEGLARQVYEQQTGTQMEPLCLVHDELQWMRASLDGLSFDGAIVLEIKCPTSQRDRTAAQQGRVPTQYYAQLRQFAVRYREARARLERATAEEHKLRAMLESMAAARRTWGSGVEILRNSRKGAVDYAAIPELRGVNLETYRKPSVPVVRINLLEPGLR